VAAITHAAVLVAVVYVAAPLVGRIPLAALSGVLLVTAYRMVEPTAVAAVMRSTRSDALVMAATAVATVALDLVTAVEIGIAVAVVLTLRSVARASAAHREPVPAIEVDADAELAYLHDHIAVYRLDGAVFFGVAQKFLDELTMVGDVRVVILRLSSVSVLDATGAKALGQIIDDLSRRGVTVLLKGAAPGQLELMRRVGALDMLATQAHVFGDLESAVAHARRHVARAVH
jgi:SulP family sulfate permease